MKQKSFFLLIFILAFFQCEKTKISEPEGQGNASETVAKGLVRDESGVLAMGAKVLLLPTNFNPFSDTIPKKWEVKTNQQGLYTLSGVPAGSFNIIAESDLGTKVFISGINISSDMIKQKDTVKIELGNLQKTGRVQIAISDSTKSEDTAIFIQGTNIKGTLGTSRITTLENVPVMDSAKVFKLTTSSRTPKVVSEKITIKSGETAVISRFNEWSKKIKISINTAFASSPLVNNVLKFPLLVRLNKGNFNFSDANPDGSDIRFSKSDGYTDFPYEIENWDHLNEAANIWVLVDTVFANKVDQHLFIYAGNKFMQNESSSYTVFSAENGFRSVWHLAENNNSSIVKDAVGNFDGGLKSGGNDLNTSKVPSINIIGNGFNFNQIDTNIWVNLGDNKPFINNLSQISFSVWVKPSFEFTDLQFIFSLSTHEYSQTFGNSRISMAIEADTVIFETRTNDSLSDRRIVQSIFGPPSNSWYFITGVANFSENTLSLYINGELKGFRNVVFSKSTIDSTHSKKGAIGSNDDGSGLWFKGHLDEVRLSSSNHSPDWIKLSYENQKFDQKMVIIE